LGQQIPLTVALSSPQTVAPARSEAQAIAQNRVLEMRSSGESADRLRLSRKELTQMTLYGALDVSLETRHP
jgi:hypothetical protein